MHPTSLHDFSTLYANLDAARAEATRSGRELRVVRAPVVWYSDGFPAFRRKMMSLEALYFSWGNLPFATRTLEDIHVLGFVPEGANLMDCLKIALRHEIIRLENGFLMTNEEAALIPGVDTTKELVFVCGGVALFKLDMVAAQHMAASKRPGKADHSDRMSHVHRDDLGNLEYDIRANRKTVQQVRDLREKLAVEEVSSEEVARRLQEMGLHEWDSVVEYLKADAHSQIPPEPLHSELLGIVRLAFQKLLEELTEGGIARLNEAFTNQPLPLGWLPLPELRLATTTGKLSTGAVDILHFTKLAPFALKDLLALPPVGAGDPRQVMQHDFSRLPRVTFKRAAKEKYEAGDRGKKLYPLFVALAESVTSVLAPDRAAGSPAAENESADKLNAAIVHARGLLKECWPDACSKPNFFTGLHYRESAILFGCTQLLNAALEEIKHTIFKETVPGTSGREVAVDLARYANVLQAVRLIHAGHYRHPAVMALPPTIRAVRVCVRP